MKRFDVQDTPIMGLKQIALCRLSDQRGSLMRLFCQEELLELGWNEPVAQINLSHNHHQGTVRGLHFQYPPHAEIKFVYCLHGAVWDVVVDLRQDSPTFLQWYAAVLSAENLSAFLIPKGCAHGFQTLTDDVSMLYFHSNPHAPQHEGGIHVQCPTLSLPWPMHISLLSERDRSFSSITADFNGIVLET